MSFTPRDYQQEAIDSGIEFFESGCANQVREPVNAVSVIPTGGGKSIVLAGIATSLPGKTLVLQPSKEILEQNFLKTQAFGFHDLGVYSASFGMKKIRKITFGMIGSIISKAGLFEEFDRVIMDECHYANPKQGMYKDFFAKIGKPVLGLTATPYRLHGATSFNNSTIKFITRTRPRTFDKIIHITQNGELFKRGYLCPIDYQTHSPAQGVLKYNSTGAEFTDRSIKDFNEEAHTNQNVIDAIRASVGKHILAFVSFVEDAFAISEALNAVGIISAVVTGETHKDERKRILAHFRSGQIRVVLNVGVWTTGLDFPALDCVINARPTNSLALYYQIAGRGIRTAPGKEVFTYIDLAGNVGRFGRLEDFEIVEPKPGLHRLKCGDKFLTGVDLVSGYDLEAARAAPAPMASSQAPKDSIVRFGKFKGQCVKTVPAWYLAFVEKSFGAGDALNLCVDELNRRRSMGVRV